MLIKLEDYIGRESLQQLLRQWTATVAKTGHCYGLYFEAEGGFGKTRLLQMYKSLLAPEQRQNLVITRLVDFYSFENRSPEMIEQLLISGLQRGDRNEWYRLNSTQVNAAFAAYKQAYRDYEQARYATSEEITLTQQQLRESFIAGWNQLAATYTLVMRFDTLETLFSYTAPVEALANQVNSLAGARLVENWMQAVLPRLKRTLVLMCGREVPGGNKLINRLRELGLLVESSQQLGVFDQPEEIKQYLKAYNVEFRDEISDERIRQAHKITEGRPLLLACLAEAYNRELSIPAIHLNHFKNRLEFQEAIINTILNPHHYRSEFLSERTLIYCLYFLAAARRGIRRRDLRRLFTDVIELPKDDTVIERLNKVALVKALQGREPNEFGTQSPQQTGAQVDDPSETELLFLHDEVFLMIDSYRESAFETKEVLAFLCEISSAEVREAREPKQLLKAMSNHMYYELMRNVVDGYRRYVIYVDRLLRERYIEGVQVLTDAFWSTLLYKVPDAGDSSSTEELSQQDQESLHPNLARLKELALMADELDAPVLTMDEILRDEEVRKVALLLAKDQNQQAYDHATALYQRFSRQGVLGTLEADVCEGSNAQDQYLFTDLSIVRAYSAISARTEGYEHLVDQLLGKVIQLLENPDCIGPKQEFLRLRRLFFLGNAYTYRAFMRRQEQRFQEAERDAERGRAAYRDYRGQNENILNDLITSDLAQVTNNLAYISALEGKFRRAVYLSEEVLNNYVQIVPYYRQALFYNTNALIHMRQGEFIQAEDSLNKAEAAAMHSGNKRAQGLVAHARAVLKHKIMQAHKRFDPTIEQEYDRAAKLLHNEPGSLREVYFDWARYERDTAVLLKDTKNKDLVPAKGKATLELLGKAMDIADTPPMQQADLLESQATIHNLMGQYDEARRRLKQAEALLYEPMPDYAQVICGKIALQYGYLDLYDRHNFREALRFAAIALARAYVFGPRHRDQQTFEELIRQRLGDIPVSELETFLMHLADGHMQISADDLPYQKPDARTWDEAWEATLEFLQEEVELQLDQ